MGFMPAGQPCEFLLKLAFFRLFPALSQALMSRPRQMRWMDSHPARLKKMAESFDKWLSVVESPGIW
jgi:hypothetical protein